MNHSINLLRLVFTTIRLLVIACLLFSGTKYASAAAPTISNFTPTIGTAGTTVTISGADFDLIPTNTTVKFNGIDAVVNIIDSSTIEAVVPALTTTGSITVSTPAGTVASNEFFVVPPPSYTADNIESVGWIGFDESLTTTVTTSGKVGLILFNGTAGQRISLQSNGSNSHYLSIYNPDGSTLVSYGFASSRYTGVKILPATGTYTISVNPYSTNIGDYILTLLDETPENITSLQVISKATSIALTWNQSGSPDAEEYHLQLDQLPLVILPATQLQYEFIGLLPNSVHQFSISTVDSDANQSPASVSSIATLFDNPTVISVVPLSGQAKLTWAPVSPTSGVIAYRIYQSLTPITDISGLSHALQVSASTTQATVAQLTNDTTYHFAVTAVNINNNENLNVVSSNVTPTQDLVGPVISVVEFNSVELVDNQTISASGTLSATATDESGVSKIEYYLDGSLVWSALSSSDQYDYLLDINDIADGAHALMIKAYDSLDQTSELTKSIVVQIALPSTPTIASPTHNTLTNQSSIEVSGTGAGDEFQVFIDNVATSGWQPLVDGVFAQHVTLNDGSNVISVKTKNRGGESNVSNFVSVVLDTSIPSAPSGLSASAKAQGEITLSWNPGSGGNIAGYDVYRSTSEFTDISAAQRVNTVHITGTSYNDLPFDDGQYFYRVVAINQAQTISAPSNQAAAIADGTAPYGVVTYQAQGAFDAANNVFGQGNIKILLDVSEPLLTTPFLSIKPANSALILLQLQKDTETKFSADLLIDKESLTGVAAVIFSAGDIVNNQGTELQQGASITIDTRGPQVTDLQVTPLGPIKNDQLNPVSVNVQITLDEKIKTGELASLSYLLSDSPAAPIAIDDLAAVSDTMWTGSFTLPADTGLTQPQLLSFNYQGLDELDNTSTTIVTPSAIQVYQGNLPPFGIPTGLTATAKADGAVELSWFAVADAADYQLYRQAPGESVLSLHARTAGALSFNEQTVADGEYQYAVASVRQDNGEEALSVVSNIVTVTTDRVIPQAPQNLTLALSAEGVSAAWELSSSQDIASYQLYRAQNTPITNVDGLQPNISDIPSGSATVLDSTPAHDLPAYVVVAVDTAGNLSAPSNTGYLNVDLLPVSTLKVEQYLNNSPVLSWTHSNNSLSGYDIYIGDKSTGFKLNSAAYTGLSYTDSGYANTVRQYTVVALDVNSVESIERSIDLPQVDIRLAPGEQLKTNLMNEVQFIVDNQGLSTITNAQLKVDVGGVSHYSTTFNVSAASEQQVTVIIGGYDTLSAMNTFEVSLVSKPNVGEEIVITRDGIMEVLPGALSLNLETQQMFFGGQGQVRFTLENTGETLLEIITALNNGNNDSNDIRLLLKDLDGNVLSSKTFRQVLGGEVVNLTTGQTVARVAANQSFVSQWLDFDVPAAAPDTAQLVLEIDNIYRDVGQANVVTLKGTNTTRELSLTSAPYYANNVVITPLSSFGSQDIVITAQALDTATALPVANVELTVVTHVNGFEKKATVITDNSGNFSYSYVARADESGQYKVSVVHPLSTERPAHGTFLISKVHLNPDEIDLAFPTNYTQSFTTVVSTGEGADFSNVRLELRAEDQPESVLPTGITFNLPEAISLGANQSTQLNLDIIAGDNADEQGSIVLALLADESTTQVLAKLTVNYQLITAQPSLYYVPSLIDTGLALDGQVTESVILENRGVEVMRDINLQLLQTDDLPAPSWISLAVATDFGDIAIGGKRAVTLNIQPQNQAAAGVYEMKLKVSSSNHPVREIPIFISLSNSGDGGYQFKVSDAYTATLDDKGNLIQGLAGATVRLQNEDLPTLEYTMQTNAVGEAFFSILPVGRYSYWVSADKHQERHGRVEVRPSIIRNESVFLDYSFIALEWSVREITIEDRYEIVLNATYEVDVPAAVVVLAPSSISLPEMAPGDVFYGELTITNHGFIRADDISYTQPQDSPYYQFDFLTEALPKTLEAKGVNSIPYRITALQSLQPELDGSGGGCYTFKKCLTSEAGFQCPNGELSSTSSQTCWVYSYGTCGGGGYRHVSGWIEQYSGSTTIQPQQTPMPCRSDGKDCKIDGNSKGND